MITLRRNRLSVALFALLSLLFMHLALASHVCPGSTSKGTEVASLAGADLPCAEPMAPNTVHVQPNLCQAHCQAGPQSSDTYKVPPMVIATTVVALFPPCTHAPVSLGLSVQTTLLTRTTAPPLAVRHCCFRI